MRFDHHVHLEHGPYHPGTYPEDWLGAFVEMASRRGTGGLGVVEHGYRFWEARGLLSGPWAEDRCRYALSTHTDWIQALPFLPSLAWGLEMDYVPEHEAGIRDFLARYPWDFVLGSVHWLGAWGIDVWEMATEYTRRDPLDIWEAYYSTSVKMVASGLFDVATHPDLPKIFGHPKPPLPERQRLYRRFSEALADTGTALEINTAGLRRPVGEIYPEPALLHEAFARGVSITLASDAHEPENAGRDLDQAEALAQSIGWTSARGFLHGRRVDVRFE